MRAVKQACGTYRPTEARIRLTDGGPGLNRGFAKDLSGCVSYEIGDDLVGFVDLPGFHLFEVDSGGLLGGVAEPLADDRHGDAFAPCTAGPGMAGHVEREVVFEPHVTREGAQQAQIVDAVPLVEAVEFLFVLPLFVQAPFRAGPAGVGVAPFRCRRIGRAKGVEGSS